MKRILVIHDGGFGSQIQMCGVWLDLIKEDKCDLYLASHGMSTTFWDMLSKQYNQKLIIEDRKPLLKYEQILSSRIAYSTLVPGKVTTTRRRKNQSEVKDNELILKKIGIEPTPVSLKWKTSSRKHYDILICNGSLDQYDWLRKKYT